MTENGESAKNGSTALAKLLNQINIPTLLVILLTGGGNLFQGAQISTAVHQERDRTFKEVHELHSKIDEFEQRQIKALENQEQLIKSNMEQIRNQTELLQTQHEMLDLMRKTQKQFLKQRGQDEDRPPAF